MLNTFEKTKAHEARRAAIQKQMEAMEVAASNRQLGASSSSTSTQTLTTTRRRGGSPGFEGGNAPAGSLETARRFLWDEDDEPSPSQMTPKSGRNVYSTSPSVSRPTTTRGSSFFNLFQGKAGGGQSQRMGAVNVESTQERSIAASYNPNASEYRPSLPVQLYLLFRRVTLKCALAIGSCVSWFGTTVGVACGGGRGAKLCFLLFAITVVTVPVLIFHPSIRGSPDAQGDAEKDTVTASMRYDQISRRIAGSGLTGETILLSRGSPQNKALLWITAEDPAQLKPDDKFLLERYSLAVFYYATHDDFMFQTAVVNLTTSPDQGSTEYPGEIDTLEPPHIQPPAEGQVETIGDDLAGQPTWVNEQGWLSGRGYCLWHGVECHHREGSSVYDTRYDGNNGIILLNMTENNVRGQVPTELFSVNRDMRWLSLSGNGFFGTVPTEISKLTQLRYMSLANNFFTGSLPNSIHKLSDMTMLYLDGNYFQGRLPNKISDMSNLVALSIYNNQFSGTISPDISKLRNLTTLYLDINHLTGTIPSAIGTMRRLVDLRLRHNKLVGSIPSQLGGLTRLEILYLDRNTLTGFIPTELGRIVRMSEMHLYRNKLKGPIPTSIGRMHDLASLYLDNNHLTGGLPTEFGKLVDLQQLFVHKNYLNGTLPSEMGNMQSLKNFRIYTNGLVGTIPSEIGKAWKLEFLFLEDNIFSGTVPKSLGDLNKLEKLRLYWNKFTGSVPAEICGLMDYKLTELKSDCGGDRPKITCSCCTTCFA